MSQLIVPSLYGLFPSRLGSPALSSGLPSGEWNLPRAAINSNGLNNTSGSMRIHFFQAMTTETISQLRTYTGTTPATGITLARMGVYAVNMTTGDCTLAAACANDTTLWGTGSTAYTRSTTSNLSKVSGQWYAIAVLYVRGVGTDPQLCGISGNNAVGWMSDSPYVSAILGSQTDLPASFNVSALTASTNLVLMKLIP